MDSYRSLHSPALDHARHEIVTAPDMERICRVLGLPLPRMLNWID